VDRLGVQADVFALAKAGLLPTSQFLDVAAALAKEVDYTVWNSLASNIGALQSLFAKETFAPQLRKFVEQLFLPLHTKLGWKKVEGERDIDALLRAIALRKLSGAKHEPVIAEARRLFEESLTGAPLHADVRSVVYESVAINGNEETYNKLVELYKKADTPELKIQLLSVLPLQPTPELTRKAFEFSLGGDVRDQDLYHYYFTVHGVPHGTEIAWNFLRENWDTYHQRLGKGSMMLARIIGKGSEKFAVEEKAKEVEKFFEEHPFQPAERTVKQSVETIRRNAKWLNLARDDVAAWLKNHGF